MRPTPEQDQLLKDVLHEEGYSEFRRDLCQQALAELRQRRRRKRVNQLLALAACVALGLGLALSSFTRFKTAGNLEAKATAPAAHSAALSPERQIPANAPPFDVITTRSDTVSWVTEIFAIEVVRTEPVVAASVSLLSDDELLAEFDGRPAALVASSQGIKQLFLLDAEGGKWSSGGARAQPNELPR